LQHKPSSNECAETVTALSPHSARLILEPYFNELKDKYIEAGFEEIAITKLRCTADMHDTPRHFAGCLESGEVIYAAPHMAELPVDTVLGILAHELGHAADFLYPAQFVLRGDHVVFSSEEPHRMQLKGWRKRDDDTIEIMADYIAEYVLGTSIGYRGPCHLQCLGVYSPRPMGLR